MDAVSEWGTEDVSSPAARRLPTGEGCTEGVHLPRQLARSVGSSVGCRQQITLSLGVDVIIHTLIDTSRYTR